MPSELCRFSMLLWLMKIAAGRKQSSQEGTKSTDWLLSSFILSRPSEKTTKIPGWLPIFLLGWHHLGTWSWWRHLFSCQLLSLCFSHTKRTMLPYSGFLNLFVVWNKRWRKGKAHPFTLMALPDLCPGEKNVATTSGKFCERTDFILTLADFLLKTKYFWKMLSFT